MHSGFRTKFGISVKVDGGILDWAIHTGLVLAFEGAVFAFHPKSGAGVTVGSALWANGKLQDTLLIHNGWVSLQWPASVDIDAASESSR